MPSIFKVLLSAIAFKILVLSCSITGSYDLTFYVTSSTNDWITCNSNPAVKAVLTSYPINGPPVLPSIWDTYSSWSIYHCVMTKSFFVSGIPTGGLVDVFADDYITMKINDVLVGTVSYSTPCIYQNSRDIFAYIKPGLNTLYIDVYNSGGWGYFGYKLTIKTKLF